MSARVHRHAAGTAPAEETVDFDEFNMEPVGDEEQPAPSPWSTADAAGSQAEAESGARELDFGAPEGADRVDTGWRAPADESAEGAAHEPAAPPAGDAATAPVSFSDFGEFNFAAEGPLREETDRLAAFATDAQETTGSTVESPGDEGFGFDSESAQGEEVPAEFSFAPESDQEPFAFGADPDATAEPESFNFDDREAGLPFEEGLAAGEEDSASWETPGTARDLTFDFDEPDFSTEQQAAPVTGEDKPGLGFGEIDFGEAPQFDEKPEPAVPSQERPAPSEVVPPAPVPPVPPLPRAPSPRPYSEEPLAVTPAPPRRSGSKLPLLLVLLLLMLGGAAGYFYLMGNGQQLFGQIMTTLKGEQPVSPVEQRIGLNIDGSSYVDNREAGQLLVIQGSATNNFAGARSAITVKGIARRCQPARFCSSRPSSAATI